MVYCHDIYKPVLLLAAGMQFYLEKDMKSCIMVLVARDRKHYSKIKCQVLNICQLGFKAHSTVIASNNSVHNHVGTYSYILKIIVWITKVH